MKSFSPFPFVEIIIFTKSLFIPKCRITMEKLKESYQSSDIQTYKSNLVKMFSIFTLFLAIFPNSQI